MTFAINYRGILWCILIAAMAVGAMICLTNAASVSIEDIKFDNGSYVIVTADGPIEISEKDAGPVTPPTRSHYIEQGEKVYLGDIIDISGVVPPYPQLAYWDGYDMYNSQPEYNITLPQRKSGYYNFTLDPAIFASRQGRWYKYDNKFERQGNNLAFIVIPRPLHNYTMTFPNGTVMYLSELVNLTYDAPAFTAVPELMPKVNVADYLVTSEDSLNITVSRLSAGWIFNGDDNSILYVINNTESQILFDKKMIGSLEPGEYKIIIQSVTNYSGGMDVKYADGKIKWFDRSSFKVNEIPAENLVPSEAIKKLEGIFPLTYDTYSIHTLAVQDPTITIAYMNEVGIGSAKEYYKDSTLRGNVSLMDVRGYTNVLPGVNVSVTLDEAHNNPREVPKKFTFRSEAVGTYLGDMRAYRVYVPLYWDDLAPGMHNLTARTELGGMSIANFPVHEELAGHYIPPQTNRFMGSSNPWVPTPTPEVIVKKETVVVTQTIPVQIQPSEEQIKSAAGKIVEQQNRDNLVMGIIAGIVLVVIAFIGWFAWSVYRARKNEVQK